MPPKNSVRNKAEPAQTRVLGTKPSNGGALMQDFFEDDKWISGEPWSPHSRGEMTYNFLSWYYILEREPVPGLMQGVCLGEWVQGQGWGSEKSPGTCTDAITVWFFFHNSTAGFCLCE